MGLEVTFCKGQRNETNISFSNNKPPREIDSFVGEQNNAKKIHCIIKSEYMTQIDLHKSKDRTLLFPRFLSRSISTKRVRKRRGPDTGSKRRGFIHILALLLKRNNKQSVFRPWDVIMANVFQLPCFKGWWYSIVTLYILATFPIKAIE